ncbi:4a-hydroxytetrahydrobiopterin dehydratase [Thermosynechococcus sp. B0]|uniref:4a-hydroxytetrahydrobiopterin dehydratase n=1 Tax=unclassified Thermosynechococcus TaxID=2622553 RepID=UPI00122E9CF2|nr:MULTISPECIES: 4a-hydroxytetrahydrobiopterin dehydratase [unclassified Thermosynechococcus]QEQ01367.1 4a-hydroxytetrahydrobiopterin dehydratase [Thermosynechococcus sp. CL-1]WJI23214.1 4a-hydroxytetrahydrobiopterin dehydratase [Thermosynechococcus sp. B0]
MAERLSAADIEAQLANLAGWKLAGDRLEQTFVFKDFLGSIAFVNRLVDPAEQAGHHPDLSISWNRVTVCLTTHDAGGITQKDIDLAKVISDLAAA